MSRGKRYEEPKLNMKKVFAVIIALIVIIMFIVMLTGIFSKDEEQDKIVSKDYFSVFQNNKWGVIDSTGAVVIDPSYEEMITVPNNDKDVFLCVYDVNYDTGTYKTKALNGKNEEIFTQYDNVEAIQFINENQQVIYNTEVLKVQKDGKYGIIDFAGKQIIPCQYDNITALQGIQDTIKVQKDSKYGLVDIKGKELISTQYADIKALKSGEISKFIVQNAEGKYGVVSSNTETILQPNYEEIKNVYTSKYYVVKKDGKEILINKDGTDILTSGFDHIQEILKNEENGIIFIKDGKYGVMKLSGEITIEPIFEDLKEAKTGTFIAKQNGKYGIIDLAKNEKLGFIYQTLTYYEKPDLYIGEDENFNNTVINGNYETKQTGILTDINEEKGYFEIRQEDEYNYYNFKFEKQNVSDIFTNNTLFVSKKDGKYGFVDKDGKIIVDYIYDDATEQNEYGYAGIKKDGKWGSIDTRGNVVQQPTYNLEEYLQIDFIGRWHYGKDLDMNYYNQL